MLIACHLFFGTLLGMALGEYWSSKKVIYACIFGSLLPDLIDKPFGILILPGVQDGRMICHSFIGIFCIMAIVWFLFRDQFIALAIGAGVILHQVLDTMWLTPENWFFPLFGPFPIHDNYRYFETGFLRELTTPSEWLFLAGALILLVMIRSDRTDMRMLSIAAAMGILAVISLILGS
ncbi:MAG: metal-dependent hydrolase [Methanobacteriota archaeon]